VSLAMKAAKYGGEMPILLNQPMAPVPGATTYGGAGFQRFHGQMPILRGGMQGDPGLFGFLGKVVKGAAGVVSRLGIPIVSGAAGIVGGLIPGQAPAAGPGLGGTVGFGGRFAPTMPILRTAQQIPTPGIAGTIQRAIPGGATGMQGCGPGYRPNKSGYYVQGGQYVAPGTVCTKARRMNPLNPRALSKAMRRIESAKRATSVLSRITIRKKC